MDTVVIASPTTATRINTRVWGPEGENEVLLDISAINDFLFSALNYVPSHSEIILLQHLHFIPMNLVSTRFVRHHFLPLV